MATQGMFGFSGYVRVRVAPQRAHSECSPSGQAMAVIRSMWIGEVLGPEELDFLDQIFFLPGDTGTQGF